MHASAARICWKSISKCAPLAHNAYRHISPRTLKSSPPLPIEQLNLPGDTHEN